MNKTPISNKSILTATLVIILFTLLTLADAPGPDYGIVSIGAYNGKLIADASYTVYYSENGGLDWHESHFYDEKLYDSLNYHQLPYSIQIPDSNIHYRITTNGRIQVSRDNGASWHELENTDYQSDVSVYYQRLMRSNAYITNPGAQDMTYDPVSGNVIIAMGLQGVVVIPPDGKAVQVGIGENRPANLSDPSTVFSILSPFLLLTLVLIAICFSTIVLFPINSDHRFRVISALLLWGIFAPSLTDLFSGYSAVISIAFIFIYAIIIFSIVKRTWKQAKIDMQNKRELLRKYIIICIPGGLVFFLCYLLWYLTIITYLNWAIIISYCIALLWFIYCIIQSYKLKNQPEDAA